MQNILAYCTSKYPFNLLKQTQLLAAAPQPPPAAAATSTITSNNDSSTSTSTISISSGSNKVYLIRIFNLGLLHGFMGLSLIFLFFYDLHT
jgi:hypothetical protein